VEEVGETYRDRGDVVSAQDIAIALEYSLGSEATADLRGSLEVEVGDGDEPNPLPGACRDTPGVG
jgi:hypothetical protein